MRFKGWIPSVAGRLSFKHIGDTGYPVDCTVFNEATEYFRAIWCIQKRVLCDAPVHKTVYRLVTGNQPNFVFVLIADTDSSGIDRIGSLKGFVFVLTRDQWFGVVSGSECEFGDAPADHLTQAVGKLNNDFAAGASSAKFKASVSAERDAAVETLKGSCTICVDISVERTGEVELVYLASNSRMRVERSSDFVVIDQPSGVGTPESSGRQDVGENEAAQRLVEPSDEQLQFYLNQVYYFVKDISHGHQHHHPQSDNITSLWPVSEGDLSWARETHYSIHRKIVELRRSRRSNDLYQALGIISYIKSLSGSIASMADSDHFSDAAKQEAKRISVSYNFGAIEDSIKARIESLKWRRTQLNILVVATPALFIALVGLAINMKIDQFSGATLDFVKLILRNMFHENGFVSLSNIGMIILVLCHLYGVFNIHQTPEFIKCKRILAALGKSYLVSFYSVLTFVCVLGAIYLVGYAALDENSLFFAIYPKSLVFLNITAILALLIFYIFLRSVPYVAFFWVHRALIWSRFRGRR